MSSIAISTPTFALDWIFTNLYKGKKGTQFQLINYLDEQDEQEPALQVEQPAEAPAKDRPPLCALNSDRVRAVCSPAHFGQGAGASASLIERINSN